ncbi:hypothetical protein [Dokdonella sp.]|uniref:amino acid kinase family protein n=1 Tax=Dokdonella sp. TaxID=2291710 RepID=UPI0025BE0266|nr:hypothetical protein [Dokdonella sp.]MBX3690608.1 hypothetical protein [Dokdonella sp.]
MRSRVIKFGGTSLGDAARIARAAEAVRAARAEGAVAVVVSAMAGVTDRLLAVLGQAAVSPRKALAALDALIEEHRAVARALAFVEPTEAPWSLDRLGERFHEALWAVAAGSAPARDIVLAGGEKLSAWLLLGAVQARGVDAAIVPAEVLIRATRDGARVEVDQVVTRTRIHARGEAFWRPLVRIMPGFTGADSAARTLTLGRNASDYSAALLAAALGWPLEIWTDVAGCYSADPRDVVGPRLLRRLSLVDAHRFARAGASVIHARTLEPLLDAPVPLTIVNSFAADGEGTRIGGAEAEPLRGIARRDDLHLVRGPAADQAKDVFDRGRDVCADISVALIGEDRCAGDEAVAVGTVSIFDDALGIGVLPRCRRVLAEAGIVPYALWWSAAERAVRVATARPETKAAVQVLHHALLSGNGPAGVHVALVGASGRVARRVRELLAEQEAALAARGQCIGVVAVTTSCKAVIAAEGMALGSIDARIAGAAAADIDDWSHDLLALPLRPLVLVDCTASAEVAARYPEWLAAGIDVVTPSKHGPAADAVLARTIATATAGSGAHFLYETSVGAQLPLLRTLRELHSAGDVVESLEAVLSGTLSFVLARVREGTAFSAAVREAVRIGYAEPHPGIDLAGIDAARKLVILLRALGIAVDLADIDCTPLVDPAVLAETDASRLLDKLAALDAHWRAAAELAAAAGECWIYRARYADGVACLRPERVPLGDPLGRLAACENALRLRSRYYRDAPLTIAGPGAGIDLTAAGVFADLLDVAARHFPAVPMSAREPLRAVA